MSLFLSVVLHPPYLLIACTLWWIYVVHTMNIPGTIVFKCPKCCHWIAAWSGCVTGWDWMAELCAEPQTLCWVSNRLGHKMPRFCPVTQMGSVQVHRNAFSNNRFISLCIQCEASALQKYYHKRFIYNWSASMLTLIHSDVLVRLYEHSVNFSLSLTPFWLRR